MAFYSVEPFGELRADLRSAIIACTIANVNTSKGKLFKPVDFMPNFEKQEPKQMSGKEILKVLKGLNNGNSR